jgi:hypothetical protein
VTRIDHDIAVRGCALRAFDDLEVAGATARMSGPDGDVTVRASAEAGGCFLNATAALQCPSDEPVRHGTVEGDFSPTSSSLPVGVVQRRRNDRG